ncbi:MAG: transposase, partial [Actinomycetota bacterium]|nr:transposase [Actinomycetota bacterium]
MPELAAQAIQTAVQRSRLRLISRLRVSDPDQLSSTGTTTQLGEAHYRRTFKTLHILAYVHDETYRRQIKGIRNLQEGRHDLGRHDFHGGKGELRQQYQEGMEDPVSGSPYERPMLEPDTPESTLYAFGDHHDFAFPVRPPARCGGRGVVPR